MSHQHHHDHGSTSNLKVAFFLNLGFTLIEIVGGLWTNSMAILSDAVHDLGDSISLGLAWYFDRKSKAGPTATLTYGFRRYRLLGGLFTGVILLVGLGIVLWHAVHRLFDPGEVKAPGMMALAVLGILVNGAAVLRVKKGSSLTEKLVSWHLIEDVLGWVVVLVGAGIILIWNAPIVDPILSIGISLFILWNVGGNLRKLMSVFLQGAPEGFDVALFEEKACELFGVESLHHVHCWTIDGESHVFSAHVVRNGNMADDASLKEQIRALLDEYSFDHITLEIESEEERCPQKDDEDHLHEVE